MNATDPLRDLNHGATAVANWASPEARSMTSRPFNVAEREYVIQRIETAFDSPFSGSVYGGYNYVHPYNTCPNGVSYITLIMLSRVHPEQIQALHEIEGDWNQLTVAQLAKELVTATDELIARSLLLLP